MKGYMKSKTDGGKSEEKRDEKTKEVKGRTGVNERQCLEW